MMTVAPTGVRALWLSEVHPMVTDRILEARRLSEDHPSVTETALEALVYWIPTDPLAAPPGYPRSDWHAKGYGAMQNPLGSHAEWRGKEGVVS